jgi:DNA repair protein RecN (Recombination protein N)
MLTLLTIENFAIIERIEVSFGPGLVALTGETGAGKSIIIDAVGGLLGNRLGADVIRAGASQVRIEGIFDRPREDELDAILQEIGVPDDDESVIVAREIARTGRSVARVNARAVSLSILQRIGRFLLDLHGQGEHLALLRVPEHIRLLDGFAGLDERRAQIKLLAGAVHQIRTEIQSYNRDQRELARRVDLLRFQVNEIDSAKLEDGEEDRLRQERVVLANAEKIATGIDEIREILSDADRGAALDGFGDASARLTELARLDPALEDDSQALELLVDQATDLARRLRRYRESVDFSGERLEAVEERLALIHGLQRKYGSTIADVLSYAEESRRELNQLEHREERLAELVDLETRAVNQFVEAATALSHARARASDDLAAAIERELAELNMAGSRFQVRMTQDEDPRGVLLPDGRVIAFDTSGIDRVEFFIAPNLGEELKPVVRVVSGGETARIMLALKTILAAADQVPTLIFDEVDAGLGGQTAVTVGRKIAQVARERQILCVTHLSQIAAFADQHLSVRKSTVAGRTVTEVRVLEPEDRVGELASMIGGGVGRATADAHARDALATSTAWKSQLAGAGRGSR